LMGVYGISFLVMMVNVALARILWHRRLGNITRELVPCGILVGLACWYGQEQLAADAEILHRPQTPRIAVLQGNQPQDLRNDPHQWRKIDEVYFRLGEEASRYQPELIIAPETCISVSWVRLKEGKLPTWLGELQEPKLPFDRMAANAQAWTSFHTRRWQADLFFGFNCWDLTGTSLRHTNSALLISREGEELAHYDKIICLPFGEYIPCAETLPFMKWLSPYPFEYTVRCGESIHSIPWRNYRIGTLICYEDSAHDLCRAFLLRTNPSFWINISNDGWFKGSEEHEQHLVSARFRCVETRRSMVRAVNMGISCIMDAMGRIIAFPARSPLPENHPGAVSALDLKGSDWHTAKNHEGILIGSVPIYEGLSPYTQFGDLLPWLCWAVMILAWFMSVYRNCKKA
ncbi:MAG TPA: apolipoprotein N-acyltransferase, partial [Gemmatales bacterium]|nr:apolipoprotein N-acyltransferase [Gemmatales bacterium]